MDTRDRLLKLLREQPRTISEIANELGLARNAITVHIDKLMSEGAIEKAEIRRSKSAGKPAQEFVAAPGTEDIGSAAYTPFVTSLLQILAHELDTSRRKRILQQVGADMAQQADLPMRETLEENVAAAIDIVNSLGATAEWSEDDRQIVVRNVTCPLAGAVRVEPCVCDAVAAFFAEATGRHAVADCSREKKLVCRYLIDKAPLAAT